MKMTFIGGRANGQAREVVDSVHRVSIPIELGRDSTYRRERIAFGPGRSIEMMIAEELTVEQAVFMVLQYYSIALGGSEVVSGRLLSLLAEWEQRTDHDIGPGLYFMSASIEFLPDGSGYVVAELSTEVPDDTFGERVDLSRLMTKIGVAGISIKKIGFDDPKEAFDILSKPLSIEWNR